jgi:hypothetical protein
MVAPLVVYQFDDIKFRLHAQAQQPYSLVVLSPIRSMDYH